MKFPLPYSYNTQTGLAHLKHSTFHLISVHEGSREYGISVRGDTAVFLKPFLCIATFAGGV